MIILIVLYTKMLCPLEQKQLSGVSSRTAFIFTSALSASYRILPQWNVGTSFYYVGERKDIKHSLPALTAEELTLDGFFDLNFSTDYTFLKRWTAFVDLSNVLGQSYQRWTSYPVQGFQFLAGVKYRFNVK